MQVEYRIGGLKCRTCVATVEQALTALEGVSSAKIAGDKVTLESNRELSPDLLNSELRKVGQYTVEAMGDKAAHRSGGCCCN